MGEDKKIKEEFKAIFERFEKLEKKVDELKANQEVSYKSAIQIHSKEIASLRDEQEKEHAFVSIFAREVRKNRDVLRDLGAKIIGWVNEDKVAYNKECYVKSLQYTLDKLDAKDGDSCNHESDSIVCRKCAHPDIIAMMDKLNKNDGEKELPKQETVLFGEALHGINGKPKVAYSTPSKYKCVNCGGLNDMGGVYLRNINLCDGCVAIIMGIVTEEEWVIKPKELTPEKDLLRIAKEVEKNHKNDWKKEPADVEAYLGNMADALEPNTHCCECTPGDHFERHMVHIQYPDCTCDPKKYVLKRNPNE